MRKKNNLADRFTSNRTPQEETLNPGVSSVKEEQFSEENLEMEELVQAHKEEVRQRKEQRFLKFMSGILIAGSVYLCFLIYGVFVTDYHYTDDGKIAPEILTVKDIKQEKEFDTVLYQYLKCRDLYEKALMLDYRLGKGEEDPLTIAPLYEELLDEVSDLSIKTDALTVETKYTKIKEMLLSWIKNDIAVYLQNMSSSISQNNSETAQNALSDRNRTYANFSNVTQNIVALGDQIEGVDLTDIKQWTPEDFVNTEINGE